MHNDINEIHNMQEPSEAFA